MPFWLRVRTYTAFISACILNLGAVGVKVRQVCSYGFNCHGCAWATFACPIGVFSYGAAIRALPALALASILAVGVVLGRLVCGWGCPFGLLQDALHKIPGPKIHLPRLLRYGKYLALALLVFLLPYLLGLEPLGYLELAKPAIAKAEEAIDVQVAVENHGVTPVHGVEVVAVYRENKTGREVYRSPEPIRFPEVVVEPGAKITLPTFRIPSRLATASLTVESPESRIVQQPRYSLYFCKICPAGTLTAHLPRYLGPDDDKEEAGGIYGLAGQNTLRLTILGVFLLLMWLASRPFCRMLCPLGASYAIVSPFAITRLKLKEEACVHCGLCSKICPVELDVPREVGGMECIACGDCRRKCPKGAIERKAGL